MLTDLSGDALLAYRSSQLEPPDFDDFWAGTLADASGSGIDVRMTEVETRLATVDVFDVTFRGFAGQDVRARLRLPAGSAGPLPAVVQYVGYGGGRGHAMKSLLWASARFAHLQIDTRGQGAGWSVGDTPRIPRRVRLRAATTLHDRSLPKVRGNHPIEVHHGWRTEDDNKAGKDQLGLDAYQVRKWDPWHRHVTISMLAHAFLAVTRAGLGKDEACAPPPTNPPALAR